MEPLSGATIQAETAKQKIARLREENLYIASFVLSDTEKVTFSQAGERMNFEYRTSESAKKIADFPLTEESKIFAEYMLGTQKIFFRIGNSAYIFDKTAGKLHTLPYEMKVRYIKPSIKASQYLVVTEKGTFLYDTSTKTSVFQYLFRDFVYWENASIGVIYDNETQKKENFGLTQKGNLILYYTPSDKKRKVLLVTDLTIDRIELQGQKVIVSAGDTQYELQNF